MEEQYPSAAASAGSEKNVSNVESIDPSYTKNEDIESFAADHLSPAHSLGTSLHNVDTEQYGKRPDCFSSTTQECLFVLTATLAIGQASICVGAVQPITSYIAETLDMKPAEVTWISAASSYVAFLMPCENDTDT